MAQYIATVTGFVAAHHGWAFWIAGLLAFGETLALVSLFIPATTVLVAVGGMVSTGALSLLPVWAGAALGSVVGSTLSWWLGWVWGEDMFRVWPLSRDPARVERGAAAFRRWGLAAVAVGHFFGPLRSVVFVLAGATRIPFLRFQMVNLPACLIWAYVVPSFGEVGGALLRLAFGR